MSEPLIAKYLEMGDTIDPDIGEFFSFFSTTYQNEILPGKIKVMEAMTHLLRLSDAMINRIERQIKGLESPDKKDIEAKKLLRTQFLTTLGWIEQKLEGETRPELHRSIMIFCETHKTDYTDPYPELNTKLNALHDYLTDSSPVYRKEREEMEESKLKAIS
ncbi:MAG: hypothetical protein ACXAE3_03280 [Candidatus Kariarchaeaceae archaeon]|jgi:hypothetical protein